MSPWLPQARRFHSTTLGYKHAPIFLRGAAAAFNLILYVRKTCTSAHCAYDERAHASSLVAHAMCCVGQRLLQSAGIRLGPGALVPGACGRANNYCGYGSVAALAAAARHGAVAPGRKQSRCDL